MLKEMHLSILFSSFLSRLKDFETLELKSFYFKQNFSDIFEFSNSSLYACILKWKLMVTNEWMSLL